MAAFNLTAQLNIVGPNNLKPVISNIRKQLSSVTGTVNIKIDPKVAATANGLSQGLQNLNASLVAISSSAKSAASAMGQFAAAMNSMNIKSVPRDMAAVTQQSQKLQAQQTKTAAAVAQSSDSMVEFGKQSALAIRRFAAFTLVTGIIFKFTNALSQASSEFIKFNRQMVQLSQVTGTSLQGLSGLEQTITGLSTSLGVSSSSLIDVSSTLAQAGLSAGETEQALKALALSTLAPSFGDLNETVEGSIALMRQFSISTAQLEAALGSINSVAAKFAVEADDIIVAIQRTGGVFAAASKGVVEGSEALNQFIALFTSVRATTRESAETIATGLRTIFTRIQRSETIDLLKKYGIQLTDLEGKFVGPYEAVKRLSMGLAGLDTRDIRFSSIIEELGGFRQVGKVIPLLQQFSTAEKALLVAQRGQGSLAGDAAKAQQALAIQMAKVQEEFIGLVRKIGSSNEFQTMVKVALDLASALISVADSAKHALPAITGLLAVKGTIGAFRFASGFASGMRKGGGAKGFGERMSGAPRGYADGGTVRRYSNGTDVPVALEPGEMVFAGNAAKRAGYGNLRRLNNAGDRPNPTASLNRSGGGGVFMVPGSGRGDTFRTTLPEGSFVIKRKSVRAVGADNIAGMYQSGGIVEARISRLMKQSKGGADIALFQKKHSDVMQKKDFAVSAEIIRDDIELTNQDFQYLKATAIRRDKTRAKKGSWAVYNKGVWADAFEKIVRRRKGPGWKRTARTGDYGGKSAPIDLITNDGDFAEVKFTHETKPVSDLHLLNKLLRYKIMRSQGDPRKIGFSEKVGERVPLGPITVIQPKNKDEFLKFFSPQNYKGKKQKANLGGIIERFAQGGYIERLSSGSSSGLKSKKEMFGSGLYPFPKRIQNAYLKQEQKKLEDEKYRSVFDLKDERLILDQSKIHEEFDKPFDRQAFEQTFHKGIERGSIHSNVAGLAKYIGLPKENITDIIPQHIDFMGPNMSRSGGFHRRMVGMRSRAEKYDLNSYGFSKSDEQDLFGFNKLIEEKTKEIRKIRKTPTRTYDDGSFSYDVAAYDKANDELRHLQKSKYELEKKRDSAISLLEKEKENIADTTGKGFISISENLFSTSGRTQNKILYHELTHQLLNSVRTKNPKAYEEYSKLARTILDDDTLADEFDRIPGAAYKSADVAYGRSYKLSGIVSQRLGNKSAPPLAPEDQKYMASGLAHEFTSARDYRSHDPKIKSILLNSGISQEVIDRFEEAGKEEFLTTLIDSSPKLSPRLSSTLDDTLSQLFASAGMKRQKYNIGGEVLGDQSTKPIVSLKNLRDRLERLGGIGGVKDLLGIPKGARELDSKMRGLKGVTSEQMPEVSEILRKAEEAKILRVKGKISENRKKRQDVDKSQQKGLLFAAVGLKGVKFSPIKKKIGEGILKKPVDVHITSGLLYEQSAKKVEKTLSREYRRTNKKLAKEVLVAGIMEDFNAGKTINLDFDRTLASGADKILSDPTKPQFSEFADETRVQEALSKKDTKLTTLGRALKRGVKQNPQMVSNLRVVTARPQHTMPLIQEWLRKQGLPITDLVGVGGSGVSMSDIPKRKASVLKPGAFVDDDIRNIDEANKISGMKTHHYKLKKQKRDSRREGAEKGFALERIIEALGGPTPLRVKKSIDFPNGLMGAAKHFGVAPNIPTDAKRTLSGPSVVESNIVNYLKAKGYASGGVIQKLADGKRVTASGKLSRSPHKLVPPEKGVGPSPSVQSKQSAFTESQLGALQKEFGLKSWQLQGILERARMFEVKDISGLRKIAQEEEARRIQKQTQKSDPKALASSLQPKPIVPNMDLARSLMPDRRYGGGEIPFQPDQFFSGGGKIQRFGRGTKVRVDEDGRTREQFYADMVSKRKRPAVDEDGRTREEFYADMVSKRKRPIVDEDGRTREEFYADMIRPRNLRRSYGGLIQKFPIGGAVKAIRRKAIIDSDKFRNIKDPEEAARVAEGMKLLGATTEADYAIKLSALAGQLRESGGLKRFSVMAGAAGNRKTSLAMGRGANDDAKLRQVKRKFVMHPSDLDDADEAISLTTTLKQSKLDYMGKADRIYAKDSSTEDEQKLVKLFTKQREDTRDATLFNRDIGTTKDLSPDYGGQTASLLHQFGSAHEKDASGRRGKVVVLGEKTDKSGNPLYQTKIKRGQELPELVPFDAMTNAGMRFPTKGHLVTLVGSMLEKAREINPNATEKDLLLNIAPNGVSLLGGSQGMEHGARYGVFPSESTRELIKLALPNIMVSSNDRTTDFSHPRISEIEKGSSGRRRFAVANPDAAVVISKTEEEGASQIIENYIQGGYKPNRVFNIARSTTEGTGKSISGTAGRLALHNKDYETLDQMVLPQVGNALKAAQPQIRNRGLMVPLVQQSIVGFIEENKRRLNEQVTNILANASGGPFTRMTPKFKAAHPELVKQIQQLKKERDFIEKEAHKGPAHDLLAQITRNHPDIYGLNFKRNTPLEVSVSENDIKQHIMEGSRVSPFFKSGLSFGSAKPDTPSPIEEAIKQTVSSTPAPAKVKAKAPASAPKGSGDLPTDSKTIMRSLAGLSIPDEPKYGMFAGKSIDIDTIKKVWRKSYPQMAEEKTASYTAVKELLRQSYDAKPMKVGGRVKKFMRGGAVQKFSGGGEGEGSSVPALVSAGEGWVAPDQVSSFGGYAALHRLNQADKSSVSSSNLPIGNIGVFDGPGTGTSDSIGPVGLEAGGFVIRASAMQALRANKGGKIQRFSAGGAQRTVIDAQQIDARRQIVFNRLKKAGINDPVLLEAVKKAYGLDVVAGLSRLSNFTEAKKQSMIAEWRRIDGLINAAIVNQQPASTPKATTKPVVSSQKPVLPTIAKTNLAPPPPAPALPKPTTQGLLDRLTPEQRADAQAAFAEGRGYSINNQDIGKKKKSSDLTGIDPKTGLPYGVKSKQAPPPVPAPKPASPTSDPRIVASSFWDGATGQGRRSLLGVAPNADIPGIHKKLFDQLSREEQDRVISKVTGTPVTVKPKLAPPPPPPPRKHSTGGKIQRFPRGGISKPVPVSIPSKPISKVNKPTTTAPAEISGMLYRPDPRKIPIVKGGVTHILNEKERLEKIQSVKSLKKQIEEDKKAIETLRSHDKKPGFFGRMIGKRTINPYQQKIWEREASLGRAQTQLNKEISIYGPQLQQYASGGIVQKFSVGGSTQAPNYAARARTSLIKRGANPKTIGQIPDAEMDRLGKEAITITREGGAREEFLRGYITKNNLGSAPATAVATSAATPSTKANPYEGKVILSPIAKDLHRAGASISAIEAMSDEQIADYHRRSNAITRQGGARDKFTEEYVKNNLLGSAPATAMATSAATPSTKAKATGSETPITIAQKARNTPIKRGADPAKINAIPDKEMTRFANQAIGISAKDGKREPFFQKYIQDNKLGAPVAAPTPYGGKVILGYAGELLRDAGADVSKISQMSDDQIAQFETQARGITRKDNQRTNFVRQYIEQNNLGANIASTPSATATPHGGKVILGYAAQKLHQAGASPSDIAAMSDADIEEFEKQYLGTSREGGQRQKLAQTYAQRISAQKPKVPATPIGRSIKHAVGGQIQRFAAAGPVKPLAVTANNSKISKEKQFGKIGLRSIGKEITAFYLKNNVREGFVTANEIKPGLWNIGLSKATKGYGPRLYELVAEAVTARGGKITAHRGQVKGSREKGKEDGAYGVWEKYSQRAASNRTQEHIDKYGPSVVKTPLDQKHHTVDKDPNSPLNYGYQVQPNLIKGPDIVDMNDPKYDKFLQQMQFEFLRAGGGNISRSARGNSRIIRKPSSSAVSSPKPQSGHDQIRAIEHQIADLNSRRAVLISHTKTSLFGNKSNPYQTEIHKLEDEIDRLNQVKYRLSQSQQQATRPVVAPRNATPVRKQVSPTARLAPPTRPVSAPVKQSVIQPKVNPRPPSVTVVLDRQRKLQLKDTIQRLNKEIKEADERISGFRSHDIKPGFFGKLTGQSTKNPYQLELWDEEARKSRAETEKRRLFEQYGDQLREFDRFASGGEIPIMAQEGEFVINKHAAGQIGHSNLKKLNRGGKLATQTLEKLPKYHSGGSVQKLAKGGATITPLNDRPDRSNIRTAGGIDLGTYKNTSDSFKNIQPFIDSFAKVIDRTAKSFGSLKTDAVQYAFRSYASALNNGESAAEALAKAEKILASDMQGLVKTRKNIPDKAQLRNSTSTPQKTYVSSAGGVSLGSLSHSDPKKLNDYISRLKPHLDKFSFMIDKTTAEFGTLDSRAVNSAYKKYISAILSGSSELEALAQATDTVKQSSTTQQMRRDDIKSQRRSVFASGALGAVGLGQKKLDTLTFSQQSDRVVSQGKGNAGSAMYTQVLGNFIKGIGNASLSIGNFISALGKGNIIANTMQLMKSGFGNIVGSTGGLIGKLIGLQRTVVATDGKLKGMTKDQAKQALKEGKITKEEYKQSFGMGSKSQATYHSAKDQPPERNAKFEQSVKTQRAKAKKEELIAAGFGRKTDTYVGKDGKVHVKRDASGKAVTTSVGAKTQAIMEGREMAGVNPASYGPKGANQILATRRSAADARQKMQTIVHGPGGGPPIGPGGGGPPRGPGGGGPPRGPGGGGGGPPKGPTGTTQVAAPEANSGQTRGGGSGMGMYAAEMGISMLGSAAVENFAKNAGGEKTEKGRAISTIGGSAVSGASMGMMMGSMFGPAGMAAGAVIGGGLGAVSGMMQMPEIERQAASQKRMETIEKARGKMSSDLAIAANTQAPEKTRKEAEARAKANFDVISSNSKSEAIAGSKKTRSWSQWAMGEAPKSAQTLEERIQSAQPAADAAKEVLMAEMQKTGKTLEELQSSMPKGEFDKLTEAIAMTDEAYQALVGSVYADGKATDQEKAMLEQARGAAAARAGADVKAAGEAAKMAKENERLSKAMQKVTTSFEKMANAMSAASARADKIMENGKIGIEAIDNPMAAMQQGQISKSADILSNPEAYSIAEVEDAARQNSSMAGTSSESMVQAAVLPRKLEQNFGAAMTEVRNAGGTDETARNNAKDAINKTMEQAFGPEIASGMKDKIDKFIQGFKGDVTQIDFNELIKEIPELANRMAASGKVMEALQKQAQNAANAIGMMADAATKGAGKDQEVRNIKSDTFSTIANSSLAFRRGTGEKISWQADAGVRNQARAIRLGTTANVAADPKAMLNRYNQLQASTQQAAENQQVVNEANRPALLSGNEDSTRGAIANMQAAANTTAQFAQSTKQARDEIMALPNDIKENIGGIMQELQDVMQERAAKLGAASGFMEKILTSTPQGLKKMGNTFNNLNRTLSGKGVSFQESYSANTAYNQVRRQGGSHNQAQRAAQEAYAQESSDTISMAKELAPLLGAVDPNAQNQMMASVYENMFKARGQDPSKMMVGGKSMQEYLDMMKKPAAEDPKVKALNDALTAQQKALTEAAAAAEAVLMKEKEDIIARTGTVIEDAMKKGAEAIKRAMAEAEAAGITAPGEMDQKARENQIKANEEEIKKANEILRDPTVDEPTKDKAHRTIDEKQQENSVLSGAQNPRIERLDGESDKDFADRKKRLEEKQKQIQEYNDRKVPPKPVSAADAQSAAAGQQAATPAPQGAAASTPPQAAIAGATGGSQKPSTQQAATPAPAVYGSTNRNMFGNVQITNTGTATAQSSANLAAEQQASTAEAQASTNAVAANNQTSQSNQQSAPQRSGPMGLRNIHQEAYLRGMSVEELREERKQQYQSMQQQRRTAYENRSAPQTAQATRAAGMIGQPQQPGTVPSQQQSPPSTAPQSQNGQSPPQQAPSNTGSAAYTPPSSAGSPVAAPRQVQTAGGQQNQNAGVLNTKAFEAFSTKLDTLLTKLASVNIPGEIRLTSENLGVNVTLNGGEVMKNLPDQLKKSILREVAESIINYDKNLSGEVGGKPGIIPGRET